MTRFRSIITRIVVLHVVAIAVTSILMPLALYYLLDQAANNLHRDALIDLDHGKMARKRQEYAEAEDFQGVLAAQDRRS